MSDFTIIIQGPAHKNSINNLINYEKFGQVIISCYENDNLDGFDTKSALIIRNKDSYHLGYNHCNAYRQTFTTLNGLLQTKTKFAIKVRGDESYSNLQPIINKIESFPDKYITNNYCYKGVNEFLHPADHMIGGRTDKLIKGFELAKSICEKYCGRHELLGPDINIVHGHILNEVLLFLTWLQANHSSDIEIQKLSQVEDRENNRTIMKKYTDLVKVEDLGEFLITAEGVSYNYTSGHPLGLGPVYVNDGNSCLRSIDEI